MKQVVCVTKDEKESDTYYPSHKAKYDGLRVEPNNDEKPYSRLAKLFIQWIGKFHGAIFLLNIFRVSHFHTHVFVYKNASA